MARLLLAVLLVLALAAPAAAEEAAWTALRSGGIALFRHAHAPGGGDPPGMRLGECATQRGLDDGGRAQARRIGQAFAAAGVTVGAVLSSQWCRTLETGELAFPGLVRAEPAFNSFFSDRSRGPAQTEAARRILAAWTGPGALVVSTHQVNITALTGIVPASGEGIVVAVTTDAVRVVGRVRP
jgi:phosphohistidine phosphatase SixA